MEKDKNITRRDFLTISTLAAGSIGIGFATIPFISSWLPSAKAKALGASVDIDITKIEKNQKITLEWRGQPVFVINRCQETLNRIKSLENILRDPNSNEQQQPTYIKNKNRSIREDIFVVIGICTHLGCVPLYKPKIGELDSSWLGGFFCPCHGSKFDLSGRVFKGVPAPSNLVIPPHKYLDEKILRIGED